MLTPEQDAYVAVTAHRLADMRDTGGEFHEVVRRQLLEASGDKKVRMEWGSVLPSAEVSLKLLEYLIELSPAIARVSFRRIGLTDNIGLTVDEAQGCWALPLDAEYDAEKRARYPKIYDKDVKKHSVVAHRFVWRVLIDPEIPTKSYLDHMCRVHACCNPSHLEPVTSSVNAKRGGDARHILGGQDVLFHPD